MDNEPDINVFRSDRPGIRKVLGDLEADIMEVIWARATDKGIAVREVFEFLYAGRSIAYTTVMTVMSRLADKGILTRRAEGRGYVYEAASSDAAQIAVRGVVKEFGPAALAHFVDEARADPKLLRRLERLMREE